MSNLLLNLVCVNTVSGGTDNDIANWPSIFEMLGQFFVLIFVLIFVLFLAYISTRLLGKATLKKNKGRNIEILETLSLGFQHNICLIKAGGELLLISISKDKISFLANLDPSQIDLELYQNKQPSFDNYITKYLSKISRKDHHHDEK